MAVIPLLWHTRLEYVLDLPFMYIYSPFVIYERSLRGVEPADKAALHRILSKASPRPTGAAARTTMRRGGAGNQGLEFLSPKAAEIDAWRAAAAGATKIWIKEGLVSQPMYAKLQSVLAEIRDAQASASVKTIKVAER